MTITAPSVRHNGHLRSIDMMEYFIIYQTKRIFVILFNNTQNRKKR